MRVEWAKMRARSHRWTEEVLLLTEEMRRIIVYCDWKSRWWLNQGTRRSNTTPELANGLSAYAMKQSNMYKGFAGACGRRWFPLLLKNSIPVEWPSEFRWCDCMVYTLATILFYLAWTFTYHKSIVRWTSVLTMYLSGFSGFSDRFSGFSDIDKWFFCFTTFWQIHKHIYWATWFLSKVLLSSKAYQARTSGNVCQLKIEVEIQADITISQH